MTKNVTLELTPEEASVLRAAIGEFAIMDFRRFGEQLTESQKLGRRALGYKLWERVVDADAEAREAAD